MKRKERHLLYIIILEEIKEAIKTTHDPKYCTIKINGSLCGGICDVIFAVIDTKSSMHAMEELGLKELLARKPKTLIDDVWWFPKGWDVRIKLLEHCIKASA